MSDYRLFTFAEIQFLQSIYYSTFMETFKQAIEKTMDWWDMEETKIFFQEQQYRLTTFFNESGIADEWNSFVEERATHGADIVEQIYDYARDVRQESAIVPYTSVERISLNELCDYNYELIKDVTQQQIRGIRECLIQDFAEGRNSKRTEILEKLEQIQLEPIHTFSAEQRARMIARTEVNRITNRVKVNQMYRDGVKYMTYERKSDKPCDICDEHCGEENKILVEDAVFGTEIFHPNCSCEPVPVADENGFFIPVEED